MKQAAWMFLFLALTVSASAQPSWCHDEWKSGDALHASSTAEDVSGGWVSVSARITGPNNSKPSFDCKWYAASVIVGARVIQRAIWTMIAFVVGVGASWWATNSAELKKPITNFKRRPGSTLCLYDEAFSQAGGTPICGGGEVEVNSACTSNLKIEYKAFRFGTGAWFCYDRIETPVSSPVVCTGD